MPATKKKNKPKTRKGDKRERTRAKLIEAATQIIKEKGYERTTLEEVARRAAMTRGAIYGNFRNREDLFLAVVETRWKPIVPAFEPGASLKKQMRILGQAVVDAIPERQSGAIGALSFQLYALKHEAMRLRLVQGNEEIYRWAAQQMVQYVPEKKLPMSADEFVRVIHALIDGLVALRALSPELISDEVIVKAFEALA
ncbi:MAG TPA: helix-turn-helix domain-containing protein [Pyrinomonadaceae bacterium]|nr:helix-turn-helix domain-containing protein [Pyrinomonadaceae bacterium]